MRRRKKYKLKFIMLIMFIFPLAVSAKTYGEIKELTLPSEDISEMEMKCGAGFLKVKGVEGLDEIKVKADVISGNKKGEESGEEKLYHCIKNNTENTAEKILDQLFLEVKKFSRGQTQHDDMSAVVVKIV